MDLMLDPLKDDQWAAQMESLWVEIMDTSLEEYLVEWMVTMMDVITAVLMVEMLGSKMVE